jgi:hypothetical protein
MPPRVDRLPDVATLVDVDVEAGTGQRMSGLESDRSGAQNRDTSVRCVCCSHRLSPALRHLRPMLDRALTVS